MTTAADLKQGTGNETQKIDMSLAPSPIYRLGHKYRNPKFSSNETKRNENFDKRNTTNFFTIYFAVSATGF